MSEIINLSEEIMKNRGCGGEWSMVEFVLIHALTEYDRARAAGEVTGPEVLIPDPLKVNVDFRINGVQMNFAEMMERISMGHTAYIEKKALELVNEKFQKTIDNLHALTNDAIDKFRADLNIPKSEDDY